MESKSIAKNSPISSTPRQLSEEDAEGEEWPDQDQFEE